LAPCPTVLNIFQAFHLDRNTPEFTRIIPEFTPEELRRAVKRLAPGKAVGPLGIPNEVVRALVSTQPRAALDAFNDCFSALTFPPRWKKAKLVLLQKASILRMSRRVIGQSACSTLQASYSNSSYFKGSRSTSMNRVDGEEPLTNTASEKESALSR